MSDNPDPSAITFLVLGCQRCGTSWINAALREHPEVYLPQTVEGAKKQTYFFNQRYEKGIDWYMSNFHGIEPHHKAVGEVGTGYSLVRAIPLMAQHLPHIKMVMAMRNPIDRAYSFYVTRANKKDKYQWGSFEEALEAEPELYERGRYIEQIETLLEHYPRDRMLFILQDDLIKDDKAYLRRILEFIDVNPDFEARALGQKRNSASFPRVRKAIHGLGLKGVWRTISRSAVADSIRRNRTKKGQKGYPEMAPETRASLVEYYRPYNERLSTFLERDLSHWNA